MPHASSLKVEDASSLEVEDASSLEVEDASTVAVRIINSIHSAASLKISNFGTVTEALTVISIDTSAF